ncbi:urease accessory protein UreD [Chelativorans xinjiangense]|uniref:urease accessory protein UreD n=1 Tax=Chelativorans xinjiangense TaxID=2681485 RepID=UPI001358B290|nr:urease accessory protein UreD [Chelativorans xinjiangense]
MTMANRISMPAPMQRSRGTGRLGAKLRGEKTCLDTFYQEGCCKIRLPRGHGSALEAVLINTSGGLTGGDRVEWEAEAAAGTKLVLTTQACERAYRSTGDDARVSTTLRLGAGAHVDWLPQETILFEASRLDRTLTVNLDEGATFTAVEAVLLGREAMGEAARSARLKDSWRIFRAGRLIHAEATRLTGDDFERDGLSLLSGHNAFATLLAVTPDAEEKLEALRAMIAPHAHAAASAIGERLILRILAPSGLMLRRTLAPAIALLSGAGALPRLWTI